MGGDNGVQHFYPVIAGLVLSVPMSSFLRGFLRNATFGDADGLALGILLMLVAIAVAAYLPARRAASVDPLAALRAD